MAARLHLTAFAVCLQQRFNHSLALQRPSSPMEIIVQGCRRGECILLYMLAYVFTVSITFLTGLRHVSKARGTIQQQA
jgi:hypothetical protein